MELLWDAGIAAPSANVAIAIKQNAELVKIGFRDEIAHKLVFNYIIVTIFLFQIYFFIMQTIYWFGAQITHELDNIHMQLLFDGLEFIKFKQCQKLCTFDTQTCNNQKYLLVFEIYYETIVKRTYRKTDLG